MFKAIVRNNITTSGIFTLIEINRLDAQNFIKTKISENVFLLSLDYYDNESYSLLLRTKGIKALVTKRFHMIDYQSMKDIDIRGMTAQGISPSLDKPWFEICCL